MENVGGNVTSTWTVSVDVSLSTCTSTAADAPGNTRCTCNVQILSIQLQYSLQCFYKSIFNFFVFSFFCFFWLVGWFMSLLFGFCFAVRSNQTLLLPWSNHTANGRHWQRRGMKRGPIGLLTTDFIPGVKGLLSVTFTWFKSLTQLNQKSMKSHRIYFWVELSSFQVVHSSFFFFFDTCRATEKSKKKMAKRRRGWNLTTHWKISPIAVMGLCRNGKYTRKIQKKTKN